MPVYMYVSDTKNENTNIILKSLHLSLRSDSKMDQTRVMTGKK